MHSDFLGVCLSGFVPKVGSADFQKAIVRSSEHPAKLNFGVSPVPAGCTGEDQVLPCQLSETGAMLSKTVFG